MPELDQLLSRQISEPFEEQHQKRLAEVGEVTDHEAPAEKRSKDILGHNDEDFPTQFASAEGKNGGHVRLVLEVHDGPRFVPQHKSPNTTSRNRRDRSRTSPELFRSKP